MIFLLTAASFGFALLLGWGLNSLALVPWRRATRLHWTERARRLYPARIAAAINVWLIAANFALGFQIVRDAATSEWLSCATVAWLGATLSNFAIDQRVWSGLSFKRWFGQFVLYGIFWQLGSLLTVVTAIAMPPHFGWQTWMIAGALLAVILSMIFGLNLTLLRKLNLVRPAPARIHEIAQREAERVGVRLNAAWVCEGPARQAFALLPEKDMLFSESLLDLLSDDELAGICAHEAAHLTESKWVFVGRILGTLILYPLIFLSPFSHQFDMLGVLILLFASLMLLSLYRRLGQKMEKRADTTAVEQTHDHASYARALEKIYEADQIPAVSSKKDSLIHPDLYDRMLAAGVTPSYERPKPPGRMMWMTHLLSCLLICQLIVISTTTEEQSLPDEPEPVGVLNTNTILE